MQQEKKTILGRIFGAIWEEIISLFKSNWEKFVKKQWTKVPDDVKDKVGLVIQIVENIKAFVDSPGAELITAVIPGDLDDRLKDWLSNALAEILRNSRLIEIPTTDFNETDLQGIAAKLTQNLTGLSYGQSSLTAEVGYWNLVKLAA